MHKFKYPHKMFFADYMGPTARIAENVYHYLYIVLHHISTGKLAFTINEFHKLSSRGSVSVQISEGVMDQYAIRMNKIPGMVEIKDLWLDKTERPCLIHYVEEKENASTKKKAHVYTFLDKYEDTYTVLITGELPAWIVDLAKKLVCAPVQKYPTKVHTRIQVIGKAIQGFINMLCDIGSDKEELQEGGFL